MNAVESIVSVLKQRGFDYEASEGDTLLFRGHLLCQGQPHAVALAVDVSGLTLPEFQLLNIPRQLKPIAPHIGQDGFLCYAARGSIVLDIFDMPAQVLACIDRAESVYAEVLAGKRAKDLEDEFFAYWGTSICLADIDPYLSTPVEAIFYQNAKAKSKAEPLLVISNVPKQTKIKLECLGMIPVPNRVARVCRVKTNQAPMPMQDKWPPKSVEEVLRWQSYLGDGNCRRKLESHLINALNADLNGAFCLIESPLISYGFAVSFNRNGGKPNSIYNRLAVRELIYQSQLQTFSIVRIDDVYLAQRNNPMNRNLHGLNITLIGCGTIGGYLAELMVKAGVGTSTGRLTLVDNDSLMPQNVGRHRLGFNHILQNKAEALAEELTRSSPSLNARPLPVDALQAYLGKEDLIIDATGEEALGHALAHKYQGPDFKPILKVWIEGPGIAVRSLLTPVPDSACARCLNDDQRTVLYPSTQEAIPLELLGQGCESLYVPFPATVSVQAACLAMEHLSDWAMEQPSPRLRTKILNNHFTIATPDIDPLKRSTCPACAMVV
ncbi:ThiF family adenylyltransferase [Novimethylophilus kurashikiensis]|nr:ThiF family adenylyltransferase [Novimethylophilus kurashikiensis]